jgi:GTP-binding protein
MTQSEEAGLPVVAILGRPNVGKSTLFNRLCGGHHAIVEDQPGVTRDRRYGESEYDGVRFRVVDTGGLDFAAARSGQNTIQRGVQRQALKAVEEAALLLFVVDAIEGVLPADLEVAQQLRRTGKPVLYVANKVDSERREAGAQELYALGAEEVYAISAAHGRGLAELLGAIADRLRAPAHIEGPEVDPEDEGDEGDLAEGEGIEAVGEADEEIEEEADPVIRVALMGRPNAGKSSLVNALCGEERMIVDATPGTTRDPVDTMIEHEGHRYLIIDTAGIRRRVRVHEAPDRVAMAMAEKAVGRADVAVLVVDGAEGLSEQDARIAGLVQDAGRALVLAFNKRDLIDGAQERRLFEEKERVLQFVPWARAVVCSAQEGKGVGRLLQEVRRCYKGYSKRVSTGALNRFFSGIVERHPPPVYYGHPIRLYYITQTQVKPPTFMISVNYPQGVHFSYQRYLQNQLRETFGFEGTPVRLLWRERRKG